MVQTVRLTMDISTVAEYGGRCLCCPVLQFSSADVEETVELPQLQLVELRIGCCMPVVCNSRWPSGSECRKLRLSRSCSALTR